MKKVMLMKWVLALIAAGVVNLSVAKTPNNEELCLEGSSTCTFVLLSEKNNQRIVVNKQRASQEFTPFSTFKVANTTIALEQGVVNSSADVLSYNQEDYPPQAWWPPVWKLPEYTLGSAFSVSMVAVFRQLASDIGSENMQQGLKRFGYGNQNMSSGDDDFWLNGSLKISANQQVAFLQKLYQNQFSLKTNTLAVVKEVMLVEQTEHYKIYAKTGAGKVADKTAEQTMLGWYIGFVENAQGVHYFAFNFNRKSYRQMKKSRTQIVTNHLKNAGII